MGVLDGALRDRGEIGPQGHRVYLQQGSHEALAGQAIIFYCK